MVLRTCLGKTPQVADSAVIDETAVVMGDVIIGEETSVWPNAVIRGDVHRIEIGARSSIQDGCVIHATHPSAYNPGGRGTWIGNEVTVGHNVTLHACILHDACLIGMGSIVLDGATVESEVILGAGSLVPQNKVLESGYLWLGNPVRKARELTEKEKTFLRYAANHYVILKAGMEG